VVTEGCPVGAALAEQVLERSERDLRSGAEPDAVGISSLPLLLPRGEASAYTRSRIAPTISYT